MTDAAEPSAGRRPWRAWRVPALHFAAIGALLFAMVLFIGDRDLHGDRQVLVVPASNIDAARQDFVARNRRAPTEAEEAALVGSAIDREVLFRHALDLGLAEQPAVERRLAQIGAFVTADPEAEKSPAEHASEAFDLGLHLDDIVVRRILIDGANRLIRGAVLGREPSEEALREHFERFPERFVRPEELRLGYAVGEDPNPTELPSLNRRDLARRFGRLFAEALDGSRIGEWQGPVDTRLGRVRFVIREHRPERAAELDEAVKEVRAEVRQELADAWLAERLEQLREGYDVVVSPEAPREGDDGLGREP